ncbi:hypothetical protein IP87_14955 [beta proteobacterium AAP121]|nr:hypothetical protein IP80_10745 [beta proteobacterium AAP65]KPF96075.1 hypothetical protein IP87_14955 [beta proteobacterium AAP121]
MKQRRCQRAAGRGCWTAWVLVALAGPAAAQPAAGPLPPLVAAGQIGSGWQVANLPEQKPPPTRYSAETVGERPALRLEAQASYGNLLHALPGVAAPARLAWSWRVAEPNPGTALRSKAGDDVAAKVCISFDAPLAQVPFGERTLLRIARSRTGQALPAATLCWVWGGPEAVGSVIDNAFSRRVRYLVLRNAAEAGERWFEESRDIAADFLRAFGDENTTVPPLVAVLVGADADNTGGRSVAHVTALRFAAP